MPYTPFSVARNRSPANFIAFPRREGVFEGQRSVSRLILAFPENFDRFRAAGRCFAKSEIGFAFHFGVSKKHYPPRDFDVRITPAERTYGSLAMAKSFLEMLAPAVQRLKSTFYGLHQWCKGQKVVFAICTTGATAQKQFFLFAPMVQEVKRGF